MGRSAVADPTIFGAEPLLSSNGVCLLQNWRVESLNLPKRQAALRGLLRARDTMSFTVVINANLSSRYMSCIQRFAQLCGTGRQNRISSTVAGITAGGRWPSGVKTKTQGESTWRRSWPIATRPVRSWPAG